MQVWRSALLASLLSGTALAEATEDLVPSPLDVDREEAVATLATELAEDTTLLALGLDLRTAHLEAVAEPTEADLVLAAESLDLLAPLADHAGLSRRRAHLEDASFRLLDPDRYLAVASALPTSADALLDRLLADTRDQLSASGIEGVVSGRTKSLYSASRKMDRKGLSPDELLDRVGVRVRVDDAAGCYAVIDQLHARYTAIDGTYDDYIADPRPSGYQSLHTSVRVEGQPVEFQVRTHAMHDEAEHGAASHWRYKLV